MTQTDAPEETGVTPHTSATSQRQRHGRGSIDWRAFARINARAITVIVLLALGVIFVMLGWYGAAHTNVITEQIPYLISGGLLGLGFIIMSGMIASTAMQERSADRIRAEISRALANTPATQATGPQPFFDAHKVFVLPGGRSYHVPGCPLLEGKEGARALAPAELGSSGFAACKLCEPG